MPFPEIRNVQRGLRWGRISKSKVSIGRARFETSMRCPSGEAMWVGEGGVDISS